MRNSTSHHVEHVRDHVPNIGGVALRRPLNINQLLELLRGSASEIRTAKGKKRAAQSTAMNGRRKRLKKNQAADVLKQELLTPVAVLQHTYEISYTTRSSVDERLSIIDEELDMEVDWSQEEDSLVEWLQEQVQTSGATLFDLGIVQLHHRDASMLVSAPDASGSHLLTVPRVDNDVVSNAQDPLIACAILRQTGRAELSATLSVLAVDTQEAEMLPFRVALAVQVSLLVPAVFMHMKGVDETQRRVLRLIFPEAECSRPTRAVDVPFLYSVLSPAPPLDPSTLEMCIQPRALKAKLLPFQRRSVAWLLAREGKTLSAHGMVVEKISNEREPELPLFWQRVSPPDGVDEVWYVNRLTGQITNVRPEHDSHACGGGILAEEPGLGKTLECIALILLNPSVGRAPSTKRWDPETRIHVKEIKTTLIVTPQSLAQQWVDELALHAPSLKVFVYDGWTKVKVPISEADLAAARLRKSKTANFKRDMKNKRAGRRKNAQVDEDVDVEMADAIEAEREQERMTDWCSHIHEYDVCITTYNVLAHDLGVARPPPERPRRAGTLYIDVPRARSPLVMCEWHRVIMDEVQMVGGGKTAEMVSLIPRISSFAVSGTPARSQVADLIHVLKFLRIQPFANDPKLWLRLLKPEHVNQFISLFSRYAIRTMKAAVKDELTIPKQTRFLVPIQLGKVEKHVYDQNFENALLELGLDIRGVAVTENWQIDTGLLRTWLRKLRGICTHPQVGQLQNSLDKNKPGVLKTIGEVLEGMKDQNWRLFMDNRKLKVQALTVLAQLQQHEENNINRYQLALETLLQADKVMVKLMGDIQLVLGQHEEAGQVLKEQAAAESREDEDLSDPRKGKGKQDADHSSFIDSEDGEDDGLPHTPAGEEHRNKKRALQQRLRECQIVMHKVHFLKGDVYHVLGEKYQQDENASYAAAEDLRRVLLKSTEAAARRAMSQLLCEADKGITEKELYIEVPYCGPSGQKSRDLMDEANEMIDAVLNPQSALLWRWRTHLIGLLTQPLTSGEEDADGQEYARSLETQGEAETYLQTYAALLADKREVMTSERTLLATLDVKEKKARKTKAAHKATAALLEDEVLMAVSDIEPQAENQVLHKELHDERKAILDASDPSRAVRSVMVDLNNIAVRITRKNDSEKTIAADGAKKLRELLLEQSKLMEKLHADLARLRKAFNERISYFRQLQEISDTVAEVEWEGSLQNAMANSDAERAELDVRISTDRARQRYLEYLASAQADGTLDAEEESCILCKCDFTRGYVTPCAHVFCESCMKEWLVRKEAKACPICRVVINRDQLQRFAVGPNKEGIEKQRMVQLTNREAILKSRRRIEYNFIDEGVFESIQTMESHGSYGSKIETLVQHLLYIELVEPGAKSIVFSAWADSLHIMEHALKTNGISCLRIDQSRGKENAAKKFRSDPSIQVLLLHGDRENAGLNITCASRVFLVESVVHHGFEIQAIARIDRMGQTRPTEVFCYYAEDTVERNILDLAARQGLSLYTKENSAGTLTAAPITVPGKKAVDAPSKKAQKGDFVFKTDDMLAIFFPHLFEEIEYLVPEECEATHFIAPNDSASRAEGQTVNQSTGVLSWSHMNAEAGPSELV